MKLQNYSTKFVVKRVLPVCAILMASAGFMNAQATSADSESEDKKSDVVKLSPFLVESENSDGYRSEQTLVGSRTAKSLMEVPASLSIINLKQIEDLNAVEVHEVLQFGTAGVTQNQTINDDVNIRGFRTTQSLRNGVTKTSFKRNPMYDVERIEVIKGPGAMLLGNNSFLGGGVNFVSMKPTHTPTGNAQVTIGENNYVRFASNVMGPAIDSNNFKLDYRVTLGALMGDKDKEIEEENQVFVGAGLAFYFGTNTSLLVNGYYFQDNGYFYWEDFLDYNSTVGSTVANPQPAVLNKYSGKSFSPGRGANAMWDNADAFVDVTLLQKLTDNANLRLYYFGGNLQDRRRHVRGIRIESDNVTLARQDIPLVIDNVTNNLQGDLTHEFDTSAFKINTTAGFDWSSGYNRQDLSVNDPGSINTSAIDFTPDATYFAQPAFGAGLPNTTQAISSTRSFSYYFQENVSFLNDKVILVGGLRWFQTGGSNENFITKAYTKKNDESFKTHKYGIVLRPIPSVSFYYTDAANTFPQNGVTDRFAANDQLGAALETQEGTLQEYGIKVDRQFTEAISGYGSLVFYDMSLTNVRTFGPLPEATIPGDNGIIQSPGDMADGWEVEYGLRVKNDGGVFDLLGTYAEGTSETAGASNVPAQDFVPKKISLMGKYEWTSGPLNGVTVGATYFDQDAKRNSIWTIDFPATYNLFARYAWSKNWSVQLNLNNITDERYIIAIAANGLVQTEPGFDGKLAVKYKW
jgi:outer membrane receptor protein involved in Fe transport